MVNASIYVCECCGVGGEEHEGEQMCGCRSNKPVQTELSLCPSVSVLSLSTLLSSVWLTQVFSFYHHMHHGYQWHIHNRSACYGHSNTAQLAYQNGCSILDDDWQLNSALLFSLNLLVHDLERQGISHGPWHRFYIA